MVALVFLFSYIVIRPVYAVTLSSSRIGVVHGFVVRGPTTPVCQIDRPCSAPVKATFLIKQNNNLIRSVSTNKQGYFHILLYPGSYMIVQEGCPETKISFGCLRPTQMTVKAGLNRFNFYIDTGLR